MSVEIVPARLTHVGPIANRMREADRGEVTALGFTPRSALRRGLSCSFRPQTALVGGRPEAMFGLEVLSALGGEAVPWMLATDVAYAHGRDLLRLGPAILAEMQGVARRLSNVVAADNLRAIRMLRAWGFAIDHDERIIGGRRFRGFSLI